jgi:hypothetical protein
VPINTVPRGGSRHPLNDGGLIVIRESTYLRRRVGGQLPSVH